MGQSQSVSNLITGEDTKPEVKEQLSFYVNLVDSKLENFEHELEQYAFMLTKSYYSWRRSISALQDESRDSKQRHGIPIHPRRAIRKGRGYRLLQQWGAKATYDKVRRIWLNISVLNSSY